MKLEQIWARASLLPMVTVGLLIVWIMFPVTVLVWDRFFPHLGILANLRLLGPVGDAYGIVNSLFSSLALGFTIWTNHLQRNDLRSQEEELKSQREEMRRQSQIFQRQRFEGTFFALLSSWNSLIDGIALPRPGDLKEIRGRRSLDLLCNELRDDYLRLRSTHPSAEATRLAYDRLVQIHGPALEPMLSTLASILLFLDEHEGSGGFYPSLLQSQLTRSMKQLMFYHCALGHAGAAVPAQLQRYRLLQGLDAASLLDADEHGALLARYQNGEAGPGRLR